MSFVELFVRRRVLAYMLSAAMLLFGFVGLRGIGLDRLPNVEPPIITVTTVNPGASPEIMDASVSSVLETAVNSIAGIDVELFVLHLDAFFGEKDADPARIGRAAIFNNLHRGICSIRP